jgi:uncharacterized RDD family membrane protein YckC
MRSHALHDAVKSHLTKTRAVTPEALNVAPVLLGRPLATPARRLGAMLIDLSVVAVVSSAANAWLLAAVALAAWGLVKRRGSAPRPRPRWLAPVLAALLVLGAVDAWRARVTPTKSLHDDAAEARALAASSLAVAASGIARAASTPERDEAWSEAASDAALEAMAARVKTLEAEVKRLQGAPPDWREKAALWLDDIGLSYGGALLYFTLVPLWWPGQTVGKRLLGLRVVELTGAPMAASVTFKRFGGYMAGLATGGIGLAQVIWDHNAQGLQDRAARTLVLDERAVRAVAPTPPLL